MDCFRLVLGLARREKVMRDLFWLPDEAWVALEPHLPHNPPGRPRADDRRAISHILHIPRSGGRWAARAVAYPLNRAA